MARMSPAVERQVRIEMLRARAALERETLAQRLIETGHALAPSSLLRSVLPASLAGLLVGGPRGAGKAGGASLLWQALSLLRRYPIVMSTVSSVVLGAGKRRGVLKLAGTGLAAWQLYKAWRARSRKNEPAARRGR